MKSQKRIKAVDIGWWCASGCDRRHAPCEKSCKGRAAGAWGASSSVCSRKKSQKRIKAFDIGWRCTTGRDWRHGPCEKSRKGRAAARSVPPCQFLPGFAFGSISLMLRAYGTLGPRRCGSGWARYELRVRVCGIRFCSVWFVWLLRTTKATAKAYGFGFPTSAQVV